MKKIIEKIHIASGQRLKNLRNLLLLSVVDINKATGITRPTINRIESGEDGIRSNIEMLILFYGYTLEEFYAFPPLPTVDQLRNRIVEFHTIHKSNTYNIIFKQPDLSELIEHRLLKETTLFNNWVDIQDVSNYCIDNYNYEYKNISGSLLTMVNNNFLKSKKNLKAKNKNFNLYMKK